MCFSPQRRALFRHLNCQTWSAPLVFCTFWLGNVLRATTARALFRHLNFQKWSDHGVFCAFWLGNVLRATTACTFSTSQLPNVVRTPSVLYILTWKCASRHNGVQFFLSHLASWLRTRRFSEPTFRPSGATNHWKNKVFRDFPAFSRICIFFFSLLLFFLLIFLFSLPLPWSAFHLSILNFLRLLYTVYCNQIDTLTKTTFLLGSPLSWIIPFNCFFHRMVTNQLPVNVYIDVGNPYGFGKLSYWSINGDFFPCFFHIYGTVYARVLSSKKTPLCFVHGAINPHSILAPLPRALRRRRHPAPWVLGQHCRCLSGWVGRMQLSISTLLFYRISLFFCVQLSINHYLYHDLSIIIYLSLSIYLSI